MLDYMSEHISQQEHSRVRKGSQVSSGVPNPLGTSFDVNRLAPDEKERLFRGLQRFVNAGDSLDDYRALSKGWPGFWPHKLFDAHGKSLAWADDCRALFLVFRDGLRYVWTPSPDALKRGTLSFLLGIGGEFQTLEAGGRVLLPAPRGLNEAWDKIRHHNPSGTDTSRPVTQPRWSAGVLEYIPSNDFQTALLLLWRESWRAKGCAKCSMYFVASKPAQLYCSTSCSGGVKRERTLNWWREKGSKMRAEKTSTGGESERKRRHGL